MDNGGWMQKRNLRVYNTSIRSLTRVHPAAIPGDLTQGARGFYRGMSPALFGSITSWALYFFCYNKSKEMITARTGYSEGGGTNNAAPSGVFLHLASAAAAGVTVQ